MRCWLRQTTSVIVAVQESPVECCRDDVASPGADVDVPFIAKSREAVAEFGFDADLEERPYGA